KRKTENTLVEKLCLPTDKAVKRILKKLKRGKTRIVTGADAKAMSFFYRLFPNLTGKAIRAVLKKSGLEILKTCFKEFFMQYISVVEYDPAWREKFEREAGLFKNILKDELVAVHHIGSTAVPGLKAKPVIDI